MRAHWSAYILGGISIVAACGGDQTGSETIPGNGGNVGPGSGFDIPPGQDPPPPGQDPPPGDYDDPTGTTGGSTPSGGNGSCANICRGVIAHGCPQAGQDVAACTTACTANLPALGPCASLELSLVECALRSPDFTCELLDGDIEVGDGQFTECASIALAFAQCQDMGEGGRGGI